MLPSCQGNAFNAKSQGAISARFSSGIAASMRQTAFPRRNRDHAIQVSDMPADKLFKVVFS
jgi:hypothetical protein